MLRIYYITETCRLLIEDVSIFILNGTDNAQQLRIQFKTERLEQYLDPSFKIAVLEPTINRILHPVEVSVIRKRRQTPYFGLLTDEWDVYVDIQAVAASPLTDNMPAVSLKLHMTDFDPDADWPAYDY